MKLQTAAGEIEWEETPEGISAKGRLPREAEFFQDHFPLFPVLPGVMNLEIFKQIAEDFLRRKTAKLAGLWCLTHLSDVRFSVYLKPGEAWEGRLDFWAGQNGLTRWKASLSSRGKVAAQARFILEPMSSPNAFVEDPQGVENAGPR